VTADAFDPDAEFTGKYEEAGRIGGWLLDRFYAAVKDLLVADLPPDATVLEVGCGAGYSSQRIRGWLPASIGYLGSDVGASLLVKSRRRNPETDFVRQSVYSLALPDKSVDSIVMLEVLEHLEDPQAALAELQRVSRRRVVISTPREPIWRALNFARGKYLADFGNTPGHVQHWSSQLLRRCVSTHFDVVAMRQPLPWTVLSLSPRQ
jgi:ubiquinone/menaquinone biosynthesis C-methylase UbiE